MLLKCSLALMPVFIELFQHNSKINLLFNAVSAILYTAKSICAVIYFIILFPAHSLKISLCYYHCLYGLYTHGLYYYDKFIGLKYGLIIVLWLCHTHGLFYYYYKFIGLKYGLLIVLWPCHTHGLSIMINCKA